MSAIRVKVPATLLLARDLLPTAKLVWMALHLHARTAPARPAQLEAATGLSRPTVLKALAQLAGCGWCTTGAAGYLAAFRRPARDAAAPASTAAPASAAASGSAAAPGSFSGALAGATVSPASTAVTPASAAAPAGAAAASSAAPRGAALAILPAALLADRRAGIRGKVLYGLLQLAPGFCTPAVAVSLAALGDLAGACGNTVKRTVRQLAAAGWLHTSQTNRLARMEFALLNPATAHGAAERAKAELRLSRADYKGAAIMQEYLSLLLESDEWEDNSRPGFLVNPETEARLELDRYYPAGLAFEYLGVQHDGATKNVSAAEAAAQQARDYMKLGICTGRGIPLVAVRWEDLTLAAMQRKVRAAIEDLQHMRRAERLAALGGTGASMAGQHAAEIPRLRDLAGYEPVIELLESSGRGYRVAAGGDG